MGRLARVNVTRHYDVISTESHKLAQLVFDLTLPPYSLIYIFKCFFLESPPFSSTFQACANLEYGLRREFGLLPVAPIISAAGIG